MGLILFFIFNPKRNLVHWKGELDTIVYGMIIFSLIVIVGLNLIRKYRREKELFWHTVIFWISVGINFLLAIIIGYLNTYFIEQEGGTSAWIRFLLNGLILSFVLSYIVYGVYGFTTPLRKNFVLRKMKTAFTK
ncbi:MAG: hypothetical protein FJW56_00430 [Actinobacteria bacterium]|nr:hypothetical protein [Actinomycetota bacterium]